MRGPNSEASRWSATSRAVAVAGVALLVAGGVACGDEVSVQPTTSPANAPGKAAAAAAAPGGPAAAAGATQAEADLKPPKPEYNYSPIGKRDPFRSYLADLAEEEKNDDKRRITETEKFELDQYRLTGLITATAQPRALVEDPQGKGHVLSLGTRLGKNGGRVTKITNSGIVVTEEFRDPTGQRVRVPIPIKLPRPEQDLLE